MLLILYATTTYAIKPSITEKIRAVLTLEAPFQCPKGDVKCEKGQQEIVAKYHAFKKHVEENKDTLQPQRSRTMARSDFDEEDHGPQQAETTKKMFVKNEEVLLNKLPVASNQRAFFNAWINYIKSSVFLKNDPKEASPRIPGTNCFLQTYPDSDKVTITYVVTTESTFVKDIS